MALVVWQVSFLVFLALATLHLHVSPYTKVEESFNIQAIHDILEYGLPLSNATSKFEAYFDHMTFPGAVPRTFIGSLIVSGLAMPQIWIGELAGKAAQIHVRAVLGGLNASALAIFARSVQRAYGPIVAAWYVVLQASQFHLWYYASRTLPNMFAFPLSTIALASLLPGPFSALGPAKKARLGLYLMTVAIVIFRSELLLLLGSHSLWLLLKPETLDAKVRLIKTVLLPAIVAGGLIGLLLTVTIDSYFWQSTSLLWPELSAFLSNIFPTNDSEGASAWGTQPFYWYLLVALPRLLMNQIFMIDLLFISPTTWQDIRVLDNLIPSYSYLLLYSILPHKETRFLFPIVPSLTLVAAMTCARLTIDAKKRFSSQALVYVATISVGVVALISHAILLPLSALNYPGGYALEALHVYHQSIEQSGVQPALSTVNVHLTNLALQSGVTRFLEQPEAHDAPFENFFKSILPEAENRHTKQRPPLTLQGDANHPALTITPRQPEATKGPELGTQATPRPYWFYDKSSNDPRFLDPAFWNQFDYVIVENSQQAIGDWVVVKKTKAMGQPRLLRPEQDNGARFRVANDSSTPVNLPYWLIPHSGNPTAELLNLVYPFYIAAPLSHAIDFMHDFFRLGIYSPLGPLTRGYWLDVPPQTKLYTLKRATLRGNLTSPGYARDDQRLGLNVPQGTEAKDSVVNIPRLDAKGAVDQQPLGLDELGPLVVNKDGTLSRLDNWQQMTPQERRRTIDYLKKRNMLRLEGLEAVAA